MAQLYYSPISINSGQVPSTQSNFPILVSQTDNRFKTTGNGGHVANSSGFDVRPYSDTGLTSALSYDLERYNASTGEVVMWVKVASLSSSTTPIYLGYGDTGLNTDGSSTATWSNSFTDVYHLKDGSTLSVSDSSGNHTGTNHSATAATGNIDGGAAFVAASSQYIDGGVGNRTMPLEITLTAWVNATSFPGAYNNVLASERLVAGPFADMYIKSNGKIAGFVLTGAGNFSADGLGSTVLSAGTWYYVAMTQDHTNGLKCYVNATLNGTASNTSDLSAAADASFYIGSSQRNAGLYWNGSIDEARVANVGRSADWITTEYNNQSAPGTFETLGTEVSIGGSSQSSYVFWD